MEAKSQDYVYLQKNENATGVESEDSPVSLSPVQIQQEFFENISEYDWIRYEKKNRNHLLQNIAFAMFGSPSSEGELTEIYSSQYIHIEGYTSRQKEQVMKVYRKICEQSKYSQNDEDILLSMLLVVCARPKPLKFYQIQPSNYWVDLHVRNDIDIWCTTVFRIRKCIGTTVGAKSCKVFVDQDARVYQSWQSYLKENSLPKCVMIVPKEGEYSGTILEDEQDYMVNLTVSPSPSLGLKARVLSTADTVSTVASVGALGALGVAAFTPVGPVVLAGATVAMVSTGIYGVVRSSLHLHDRRTHDQSINLTNAEARGSWFNIAASTVGLAAGAASGLLARSAAAGTNMTTTGQVLAKSVDVLRYANIITGGAGFANIIVHITQKYRNHGEKPTKLELFQFASATLFFYQSVISNRTAERIIEETQTSTINQYRNELRSNRHRKAFDKVSAETRRIQGKVQGNTEVIRGIQNIVDKDQYFADILRINKDLNQHKLRISMTADGKVNLNAQYKFDPSELSNISKEGRSQLFKSFGPDSNTSSNVPTKLVPPSTSLNNGYPEQEKEGDDIPVWVHPGEIVRIGTFLVRISASGAENIAKMLEELSQEAHDNLMTVVFNVLSKLIPEDIAKLKLLSPDEDLIVQIVKFVFNYLKHNRPMGEPCSTTDNGIIVVLKEFFQNGVVRQETILILKDRFMNWVQKELLLREKIYPNKKQLVCNVCQGVRFA